MGDEKDSRTDEVKVLHRFPHQTPDDADGLFETDYLRGLAFLGAGIIAVGLLLLIVHAMYRCCVCIRCCVLDKERGKRMKWRVRVALVLLVMVGVLGAGGLRARKELLDGVDSVSDGLGLILDKLQDMQAIVSNMENSMTVATTTVETLNCAEPIDDLDDQLDQVLDTISTLDDVFDDAQAPLDKVKDQIDSKGKYYVKRAVPLLIGAPFAISLILGCCGLFSSGISPSLACYQLNAVSCWAGSLGLPASLVVFTYLFVSNLFFADFCYFSPADALSAKSKKNRYVVYYFECDGRNPFQYDLDNATAAITELEGYASDLRSYGNCTPSSGLDDIDDAVASLSNDVDNMTSTLLSCDYFQDVVDALFNDAICDKTVNGLLNSWASVSIAGLFLLLLLFWVPKATRGFYVDGKTRRILPDDDLSTRSPPKSPMP